MSEVVKTLALFVLGLVMALVGLIAAINLF